MTDHDTLLKPLNSKEQAREIAYSRRRRAFETRNAQIAQRYLMDALSSYKNKVIAGYIPIKTEIDPLPVMASLVHTNQIVAPIITQKHAPLHFRDWHPDCRLLRNSWGIDEPSEGKFRDPDILIIPLLSYDNQGNRLGYGGGFYDRTLEILRLKKKICAIGFAYADQEGSDLPLEETDQHLDLIVTENGIVYFGNI